MIVERLTFQARYGRGDELVALFKEMPGGAPESIQGSRVLTDLTGRMFTVEVEFTYTDLNAYTAAMAGEMADYGSAEFQAWFGRMTEATEHGDRQLFTVQHSQP